MNFATLKGLTIPEGVVTQIADASGRVLWKLETSKPVILQVEKITSDTYAGETAYTGEQFILLDIYPKTNGTVKVTYGGLTKTITDTSGAEEPNAQKVFFGTFNGVSDSVATPVSGELIIEGGYSNFAAGGYVKNSKVTVPEYCGCITGVVEWGNVSSIGNQAFRSCTSLALTSLPSGITSIGDYAFDECTNVNIANINATNIGKSAFTDTLTAYRDPLQIAEGVVSIGEFAFQTGGSSGLGTFPKNIIIASTVTFIGKSAFYCGDYSSDTGRIVTLLATTPPTLGTNDGGSSYRNFDNPEALTKIVVPKGCGSAYKANDSWIAAGYINKIVEAS